MKIILTIALSIFLMACANDHPETLSFNGSQYEHYEVTESSGGKFNIHEYSRGGSDRLYLITPYEQSDLDSFAEIYTKTFTTQGFKFDSEASRYLGISNKNIVYLGVSKSLNSLGIYLVEKSQESPSNISDASTIFSELEGLY